MAANKIDARQSRLTSAQSMLGSSAGDTLDTIFPKINDELAKHFEDRNILLSDGGTIANSAGTSLSFTSNFTVSINSNIAGAAPYVISLGSSPWSFSADGRMAYITITSRTAATATLTTDASSLPAVTSSNQEIFLIAKRVGTTIYLRNGVSLSSGETINADHNTLSSKQIAYSSSTDSTTTGSNASLQAFTTGIVRLTNASLGSVSGIPAGSSGQILIVENKTGNQISINNEEATATASNRIQTGTSSNISMPNNATFMFTYDSTSSRWQLSGGSGSGSGSGGSKNYLSAVTTSQSTTPNTGNGDFSSGSTTGWSLGTVGTLTNNIPTGTPTFGSGASGNLSISTVSSGQLAGSYSLSYTSSAATTQGNMLASDAFYIDNEDQAKVLGFKFYYKAQTNPSNANWSGTSSNSFGVAVYDVTNSAWLANTSNFGMTQSSGIGVCSGSFQTASNTTQLRFVIYNANATSGAVTVYFDDFFVGPQVIPQGAVITDWQSFTPTGSWSTNTTYTGFWRRVGDTLEVSYNLLLAGAPTAAPLTLNLPAGLSIDSTKIAGSVNGSVVFPSGGIARDNGSLDYPIRAGFNSTTSLAVYAANASSTYDANNQVSNTVPVTFGSPDNIWVSVSNIPIVGWSSNVQMSNDTDTRVVAARYSTASANSLTNGTIINFTTSVYDTHAAVTTGASWKFTAPVTGYYSINTSFDTSTASNTAGTYVGLQLYKNNVAQQYAALLYVQTTATISYSAHGNTEIFLNAGDFIDLRSGTNLGSVPSLSGTVSLNFIEIKRISGPATIAASESVYATYTQTAGQSVTSTEATCNFANKVKDSHNAVTTGSGWVFTAPVSGYYSMESLVTLSTVDTLSDFWSALYWNGSQVQRDYYYIPGTNSLARSRLGYSDYLLAGQTIQVKVRAGATRALSTNAYENTISIKKIGL